MFKLSKVALENVVELNTWKAVVLIKLTIFIALVK